MLEKTNKQAWHWVNYVGFIIYIYKCYSCEVHTLYLKTNCVIYKNVYIFLIIFTKCYYKECLSIYIYIYYIKFVMCATWREQNKCMQKYIQIVHYLHN